MAKAKNYDGVSIERLPSGAYRYRVRDPRAARYLNATFRRTPADDGRDTPGTAGGDAWAATMRASFTLGLATATPATVEAVAAAYLAEVRTRTGRRGKRLNPTHVRDVQRTIEGLAATCGGVDLNRPDDARRAILAWFADLTATPTRANGKVLRHNLELAPRTRRRYLTHVATMCRWAADEDIIHKNPLAAASIRKRLDVEGDSDPTLFTIPQVRAILDHGQDDDGAWRWVVIMLFSGMRRAEALRLRWDDINWTQATLTVRVGKGGGGRMVGLQPRLSAILSRIGGPEAGKARMGPIVGTIGGGHRKNEWTAFRRVLTAAGVDPEMGTGEESGRPERLHAHSCRHTYGALMLASGMDSLRLQQYLGHRDRAMTDHYARQAVRYEAEIRAEGWAPGVLFMPGQTNAAKLSKETTR